MKVKFETEEYIRDAKISVLPLALGDVSQLAEVMEAFAKEKVIKELYAIADRGNYEFKAMGFVLARRVEELTGSNKLSKK